MGLHGNERNGWEAIRNAMAKMTGGNQRRPLLLMVFNAWNLRRGTRGVPDPNRIWNSQSPAVVRVRGYLRSVKPQFVIDLHACEGQHPVVSIIRSHDPDTLALARFIGCPVIQTDLRGTLGGDLGPALGVPSLTVELGLFDDPAGIQFGSRLIRKSLSGSFPHASARPSKERAEPKNPTLYRVTGSIRVRNGVRFAFAPDPNADVIFRADIDRLANLKRVPKGTALGIAMNASVKKPLAVNIGGRRQPFADWFEIRTNGKLVTRRPWTGLFACADAAYVKNEALSFIIEPELP
ncbi:MAG: succinylglutamate desuccinylase/aspartoacylase family protein [Deltaproteobacteria bacterium]|nr:succinylglutamate desuccinylase/aspartoacylase family protein [Deltaproteobacteria bacterium]